MATIGDLYELQIRLDVEGQKTEVVMGFRALTIAATSAGLAADFDANMLQNWLNPLHTGVSCSELVVNDVKPGTSASIFYPVSPAKTGTDGAGGAILPPQNALVTTWYTAFKGRSYRGRNYWPGIGTTRQVNGIWGATVLGAFATEITNMLTRYGPTQTNPDYEFVVISRFLNKVKRVSPVGTQITSGIAQQVVYNQRRRTVGVGR